LRLWISGVTVRIVSVVMIAQISKQQSEHND